MANEYLERPDDFKEQWQRNHSFMLKMLAQVGQNNLAEYLGVSDAKVSDMKSKEMVMMAKMCAFCMIQLRHNRDRCFTEEQIRKWDFLAELGREALLKSERMSDIL
jgi:hypothetical protein